MAMITMPAFDLTRDEKLSMTRDVESLLHQCFEKLERAGRERHPERTYCEALRLVRDALIVANDADACESAPVAKCNLYKGQALRGLKRYVEAKEAFSLAMETEDEAIREKAEGKIHGMEHKVQAAKRRGGVYNAIHFPAKCIRYILLDDLEPPICIKRGASRRAMAKLNILKTTDKLVALTTTYSSDSVEKLVK
ncbi:hypothetical protein F4778DRAFT_712306 [Xylariomycetidae sp. FL2044]|nr:hypothetical protein F4778DRAFT_712306 [Xylariomycetidae sp. FL2044]